ncbi:MAG TPA: hypothetical protein VM534_08850, partial [Thermoanaerobaculia bacterium]|nr:hypothetical protein [Thermoanaerobaculia bacterium]
RAGLVLSYFEQFEKIPPRPLLDFLGVRWVIAPPDSAETTLPVAWAGEDARVYRNPTALPRFFVPASVEESADPAGDFLRGDGRRVFAARSLPVDATSTVRLVRYGASDSRIEVGSTGPSFVASSEVALPGWRLERDGEPWPWITINGAFVGWTVPDAGGTFILRYCPRGLTAGLLLLVLGTLLTGAITWSGLRDAKIARDSAREPGEKSLPTTAIARIERLLRRCELRFRRTARPRAVT